MNKARKLVIILLIDGARPDVMQELIGNDQLRNIKHEVVRDGTFRVAVSCAPSTTGPAYLPFLTGCFPGRLGIPGIRWLDKARFQSRKSGLDRMRSYNGIEAPLLNRDLPTTQPTVFELFNRPFNIFSMITRGLPRGHNLTRVSKTFAYSYAHLTDQWGFVDRIAARRLIKALDQDPDFIFAVFPNVDSFSHLHHPFHDKTIAAYRFVDATVGNLVAELKKSRRWQHTLLILTSDHGLTSTTRHLDLAMFFQHRGLDTLFYPIVWKANPSLSVMISGNAMGQVSCLGQPAAQICGEERIRQSLGSAWDDLFDEEAVDFIVWREGAAQFVIRNRHGRASVLCADDRITYRPLTADPLRYSGRTQCRDAEQALKQSYDTAYPDALVQIEQLFSTPRCGDFAVISKNGYDLRRSYEWPEHHASHGSLCREHMLVPLLYNQKGWAERPARTVDVFNTVLAWAGLNASGHTDGRSLL